MFQDAKRRRKPFAGDSPKDQSHLCVDGDSYVKKLTLTIASGYSCSDRYLLSWFLPPADRNGSARQTGAYFSAYLRVVRLSPALPGRFAWDAPSLSRHPCTTVWNQPRPTDFGSAPLSSPARRMSQNFPPASGIPGVLVVSTSSAPAAIAASPKPVDGWGGPSARRHYARRVVCRSCIRV